MNLMCKFLGMEFRNPIVLASGIAKYGREFDDEIGLENVGGIITKTISREPRKGNPHPRIAETDCGIMNSIGLANPGIESFLGNELPYLESHRTNIIVSIAGEKTGDLVHMAKSIGEVNYVDAIELNLSCPNVDTGMRFCHVPDDTFNAVSEVREVISKPLVAKLSPNAPDIVKIARSAMEGGADALSLVNTLAGIKVDPIKRKFVLGNVTGGLSGPAIRPVGLRMVYEVKKELDIPVIAHGGIVDHLSALEYFLLGADLIAVGSGLFKNPDLVGDIRTGLQNYLEEKNLSLDEIRGGLL